MTKKLQVPTAPRIPAELLLRHSTPAQPWQLANPNPMLRAWGMSPYRPTRREFLIGAAGLLVLAPYGCGGESGQGGETTSSGTRTVDTPRGQVTIPAEPRRLIAINQQEFGQALPLGLPVIAGPGETGQPGAPFASYLVEMFGEQLDGVTKIAFRPEINLEQLAALQPDVILMSFIGGSDQDYDRIEEIAPLVTYSLAEGEQQEVIVPWQAALRRIGEQFARRDAAEEWIARFKRRTAEMRERLAPRWDGATYAIVEPYPDSLYLYGPDIGHTTRTMREELGLVLAESVRGVLADAEETEFSSATVSYEKLGALEGADVIFVPVYAGEDGTTDRSGIEELTAKSLWETLPAVRAGRVYEFTGDINYESGAMAVAWLDVVEQALLGGETDGGGTTS